MTMMLRKKALFRHGLIEGNKGSGSTTPFYSTKWGGNGDLGRTALVGDRDAAGVGSRDGARGRLAVAVLVLPRLEDAAAAAIILVLGAIAFGVEVDAAARTAAVPPASCQGKGTRAWWLMPLRIGGGVAIAGRVRVDNHGVALDELGRGSESSSQGHGGRQQNLDGKLSKADQYQGRRSAPND